MVQQQSLLHSLLADCSEDRFLADDRPPCRPCHARQHMHPALLPTLNLPTRLCSRPTAVNLSIAAEALKSLAAEAAGRQGATATSVTTAVVDACEAMLHDDVAANKVGVGVGWGVSLL